MVTIGSWLEGYILLLTCRGIFKLWVEDVVTIGSWLAGLQQHFVINMWGRFKLWVGNVVTIGGWRRYTNILLLTCGGRFELWV